MYELTEWGVSNEPADVFAKRNRFEAQPKYPQDLIHLSDKEPSDRQQTLPRRVCRIESSKFDEH